jgi:DNA polymerase-3 subunit epsilon
MYHRVIEIAVLRIEGGRITRRFQTLVNPGRYISQVITGITGITNEDVAAAPRFEEIAGRLLPLFAEAIFVAHNARFDYGFVRSEFERAGIRFQAPQLCTVKLSRKLYPQFRRHDLSSVIERHGLICDSRHRAMGDALAVHAFLSAVTGEMGVRRVAETVGIVMKNRGLPAQLERASLNELPEAPGVYIMYGEHDEILYVGKSRNIRERVLSHFSSTRQHDMCQAVARVEARPTAGELGALLLELHLIKELHPLHNQVSRSKKPMVVAWREPGADGYSRLSLTDGSSIDPADAPGIMAVFKNRAQARRFIGEAAKRHALCQRLMGLEQGRGACFGYHLHHCRGACVGEEPPDLYNARFEEAFARRRVYAWPFQGGVLIRERPGPEGEGEMFLVDQWCLLAGLKCSDFGQGPFLRGSYTFDYDSYRILLRYLLDRRNRSSLRTIDRSEMRRYMEDVA